MLDQDALIPSILEPDELSKESRKNWARLIQKIYEVDPLTCPKCSGIMKVISVIEDEEIINTSPSPSHSVSTFVTTCVKSWLISSNRRLSQDDTESHFTSRGLAKAG